jgi:hypothetical protein
MKTHRLTCYVEPSLAQLVELASKSDDRTVSNWIERAIVERLQAGEVKK